MKFKSKSVTAVSLFILLHGSSIAFANEDAVTITEEIANMQNQVMRDTEIASIERMHIANVERNIAMAQESNQRWAQQLQTETDPQRRDYYQQQIDGWNRWIATDMSNELSQRNQSLNSALTNILENQRRIAEAENKLNSEVQASLNDPNVSTDQQIRNIEALNSALEYRATVDQFTIQRQIFSINALNAQMGMLNQNSDLYRSLFGAKQNLQVVLDKTSESSLLKNQILSAQKSAIENLKVLQSASASQNSGEVEVIEDVNEITTKLNSEIKGNADQISQIKASIAELTEKLKLFSVDDPTYVQTVTSINVLKASLNDLENSKIDLSKISEANNELIQSVKAETVVDRFMEQIVENQQQNATAAVLKVSKNKKGKFVTSFKLVNSESDPFALDAAEIKELSLNLKSNTRKYDLKLASLKEDIVQWTFNKRPIKGTYKLTVTHAESQDMLTISAVIEVK